MKIKIGFKKMNKEIYNDEINNLYGNLIHKYANKNFYFSDKFLSGEKLFQENGLLVKKKNEIEDFYIKEIKKDGKNSKKSMRDLLYINNIFDRLEQKKVQYNSLQKNPFLKISNVEGRRKSCAANIIDKYKKSHAYKKLMKERAMFIANMVRMKQKEIEDDEKYIENISKLIEIQENTKEKDNTFYSIKNNPISLIKHYNKNMENVNNNTIFIINRYGNKNLRNFKNIYNDNTKLINKNNSAINMYSSLYKEKKDTTYSTFMNNIKDTKSTFLSRNNRKPVIQRSSIKTAIDFSDYKLEKLNTSNKDYIMIDDSSNKLNIKKFKKILSFKQDKKYSFNSTGKLKVHNVKKDINNDNNENNDNLSTISLFNKTNFYNLSSYSNLSNKKKKQNTKKGKIKNLKSTLSVSQGKINYNEKIIKDFIMKEKNLDKNELKWDLYKKFVGLKYKLEYNNNHKLENFCNTFFSLPKIVNDKLNKTFHLDEQIKDAHQKYVKRIMEHKIKDFNKEEDETII